MATDNETPTGPDPTDSKTLADEVVAILQYPVPLWVMNIGTANGVIFGNSNDSANWREWRENLPAGKWHIGERDGGFVRLHLELIGFRDRQMRDLDSDLRPADDVIMTEITPVREPSQELIDELEQLLDQARTGDLRGILFVAYRLCTVDHRYGSAGSYSLADHALGIKLMELELDSIITGGGTPD